MYLLSTFTLFVLVIVVVFCDKLCVKLLTPLIYILSSFLLLTKCILYNFQGIFCIVIGNNMELIDF